MGLIFTASSDRFSFERSSRIIAPIMRWLLPHLSEEAVRSVVTGVRKAAHVTEYAVLAVLVWRLIRQVAPDSARSWPWSKAALTWLIVVVYAASDEFHQHFVPSREASVCDVAIDSAGAALALLLLWIVGRWRKRW
jgi:VanZ family protein